MDGGEPDRWSAVAGEWAEFWGGFAEPVWRVLVEAADIGPGSAVLDVGCGSGELLAYLDGLGADTAGIDPAPRMVALASTRVPGADVRPGSFADLPWPDASFDLVTSVNALQFADDTLDALAACVRVSRGHVAVANWAEGARNDLDVVERAIGDVPPDGDLRQDGGLAGLLIDGGLDVVASGLVTVPWRAASDDRLVRGVLFGEEPATMAALTPDVLAAARPFRRPDGGYLLVNAFRYAVGRIR